MSATQSDATRPARAGGASADGHRKLGLALVVIATAQLMVVLDATIVNVALPHIQHALGFSGTGLEWVVNAYALTFGGLLLLGGRAGDILGRRRVFIAGIILFSLASLLGGFATTQAWLLAARAMQGVGGAIVAPTALSLITTTFPEGRPRNRAMGVYAAMSIGGAAVGLIAGGLLTTYLSWRWVLFVNVPIGIVAALLAPRRAAPSRPRHRGRFDLPGAITGTAGPGRRWSTACPTRPPARTASRTGATPRSSSRWPPSVVLLAAFVLIESRSKHALMPLRIFRNRSRSGAYLIMLCVGTAMFGMFFFLTIFVQEVLGLQRAARPAWPTCPWSAMIMVMSGVSRPAGRPDRRPAADAGRLGDHRRRHVLVVAASASTAPTPAACSARCWSPRSAWACCSCRCRWSRCPRSRPRTPGVASSLLNTGQQVGGAIGLAVLGTVAWTVVANSARDRRPPRPRPRPGTRCTGPPRRSRRRSRPRPGGRVLPRVRGVGRDHAARPDRHDRAIRVTREDLAGAAADGEAADQR